MKKNLCLDCDVCGFPASTTFSTKHDQVIWRLCHACFDVWTREGVAEKIEQYRRATSLDNSRIWTISKWTKTPSGSSNPVDIRRIKRRVYKLLTALHF